MSAELSSKSSPREAIFASVKESCCIASTCMLSLKSKT